MNQETQRQENIPDNTELKRLGELHYETDFPRRYNEQHVPLIRIHFDANTAKQMVEKGLINELIILLQYMVGEKTADEVRTISHKLSRV